MSNNHSDSWTRHDFIEIPAHGRLLALDPGTKRVGAALSDELRISVRPLPFIRRTSWKNLLSEVREIISTFDVQGLILGFPLRMDGTEGDSALEARRLFRNFSASLDISVVLQDERLTSKESVDKLRGEGKTDTEVTDQVDGEAAVLILRDFLAMQKN